MKATHKDGREFEGDEAEFYRTYQPAGFVADATPDAAESTESDETEEDASVDLSSLTRDELNAYATEHGVEDPASFKTKADLQAAIDGGTD
jgi:hypothetical protein